MKYLATACLSALLFTTYAHAIVVENTYGEALDAGMTATVTTSPSTFDVMDGTTVVLTLTAESAGFPGGSTPPGASAENVFFGRQPMTLLGTTTNAGSNPTTQITEIWYLHNPWNHAANFRVEWDGGNGDGVAGTGFGALSLSSADQGVPQFFGNDLGISVDLTGVTAGSTVVAAAVANDSSNDVFPEIGTLNELYGLPDLGGNRTGGVGSARAGAGYIENITGSFTAEFDFGLTGLDTPSRPASSAAAIATGPAVATTPAPLPGDADNNGVLNAADYNLIRTNIGQSGFALGTVTPDVTGFDGTVNIEDLVFFLEQYEIVNGSSFALAVPEPTTCGLAFMATSMLIGFRSRT